jgi:uncharacterized protein YecE (DUF72 family)
MRLHVGCAQWTHKAWPWDRLQTYATWCNAVEGNTTFYATPKRETVANWAAQTGADFRFVLKLPRTITHEQRLRDASIPLRDFLRAIEPLGARTETLWIQLPGSFGPSDLPVLSRFLHGLPTDFRYAVEVRDAAFFTAPRELTSVLESAGAEWIPFDTTEFFSSPPTSAAERDAWTKKPRMPLRMTALTDHPIVRYLGRDDDSRTVSGWQRWVTRVAEWLREGRDPTVFIHTPDNVAAPALARRFHTAVRDLVPSLPALPDPEPEDGPMTLF